MGKIGIAYGGDATGLSIGLALMLLLTALIAAYLHGEAVGRRQALTQA